MIIGLNLLCYIHEKVIGVSDGKRTVFSCGEEMNSYYMQADGKYAIQCIRAEDGVIAVDMIDMSAETEEKNREWMKEETEKNGVEPSFF